MLTMSQLHLASTGFKLVDFFAVNLLVYEALIVCPSETVYTDSKGEIES